MNEFILCANGHSFQSTLGACPYCPKPSSNAPAMHLDKTRIHSGDGTPPVSANQMYPSASDLGKTRVILPDENQPESGNLTGRQHAGRKLVGWLVSFTLNPNGVDFRLYEGRNTIGSEPGCDILVTGDPSVSARHLTILNRMGSFKFKDELSTNGTFVNDQFQEEGGLQDGDVIRVGNTVFKFRTVA